VRIFFSASSAAAGLTEKTGAGSRYRRRMGAAGAAAVLLAGLGVAAAGPASAVTITYDCPDGHFNVPTLTASGQGCTGSGPTTDVYISVENLVVTPSGPDEGVLFCDTFTVNSNEHGVGTGCEVYSH
jgi:hypothetical protein